MPRRKKISHENHSRSSLSINKDKPQQRYAANARERARMRVLSRAFCRLKTTLPWVPADTKLSKLDTLRLAASYIAHLKGILRDETLGSSESSLHPAMSMTWPFGFNRPLCGSAGGGSQEGGSLIGSDEEDVDDDTDDNGGGDDDDDGESISSCTWEEVSPPSSAKDCIHLDAPTTTGGRRHGSGGGIRRTRGQGSNNNNLVHQVRLKEESSSSSPLYLNKQQQQNVSVSSKNLSPTSNNNNQDHLANRNTQNSIIRPLSQIQQQLQNHQQHIIHFSGDENVLFPHPQNSHSQSHPTENKLSGGGVATLTLENTSSQQQPSLLALSQQTDDVLGMGTTIVGMNESSYGSRDMNANNFTSQQQALHHHYHHHSLNPHHHQDNGEEMQGVFAFSNGDLISIG